MKTNRSLYFTIFSIQIAIGTSYYIIFDDIRVDFVTWFYDNLFLNFLKLFICLLSIALWIVSVGYLNLVCTRSLLFETVCSKKNEHRILRSAVFLKSSFAIAIISFFALYL